MTNGEQYIKDVMAAHIYINWLNGRFYNDKYTVYSGLLN